MGSDLTLGRIPLAITQCSFPLILPKGFMNKNLDDPHLLQCITTALICCCTLNVSAILDIKTEAFLFQGHPSAYVIK